LAQNGNITLLTVNFENTRDSLMANFMKFFLNHVRDGAEAMYECVQDPPKSDVDLEGAWCV